MTDLTKKAQMAGRQSQAILFQRAMKWLRWQLSQPLFGVGKNQT